MNGKMLLFVIFRMLFVVVALWGLFGFGSSSLFDIVQHKFSFSSQGAAALLSLIVGLLGAISFFPESSLSRQPKQRR